MSTALHRRSRSRAWGRRQPGPIGLLWQLLRAALFAPPGLSPKGLRSRAAGFLRMLPHAGKIRHWYGQSASPALQEVLEDRPSLIACVERPYINMAWSVQRKLDVIWDHYSLLREELGFLRFDPASPLTLADLGDGLRIQLDKPIWFEHDGELTINVFSNDLRLYSLVFTLGEIDSERIAYVGALQGLCSPDAMTIYRRLTRRMHGLRPRDLLVSAFRMLCSSFGVRRILAVTDAARVSSSTYFSSSVRVFARYDSAWSDAGGVAMDGGFFELTPQLRERSTEDIPSRKRAMYRRRYAMLEALSDQIFQTVGRASREHAERDGHGPATQLTAKQ